jgi:hypothetical protein
MDGLLAPCRESSAAGYLRGDVAAERRRGTRFVDSPRRRRPECHGCVLASEDAPALLGVGPGGGPRDAISICRLGAADGDDVQSVGSRLEGADDLGRDADDVPLP